MEDASALARLQAIEALLPTLATKADLAELRGEMRAGFAQLRAEMAEGRAENQRWLIATVIGLFIGFGGLFMAMSHALKPVASASAQPPIVINVPGPAAPAR
jgi:hypothetical protein